MNEHPARHVLEELLVDAARVAHASELHSHLAACEDCTRRLRNMERARAEYALEHPAADFARVVSATVAARRAPVQRRPAFGWAVLGAALAVLAVVLALRTTSAPAIRYRGAGVALQVYVRSPTGIRLLHEGEALTGGAQLAFTYTLSEPQHLLLFGIDDGGTITRYFPDKNIVHSSELAAGVTRQLPVGIELDARRGRERLIALFSAAVLDEGLARTAIEAAWQKARARGKGIPEPFELSLSAKQISLWFEKP